MQESQRFITIQHVELCFLFASTAFNTSRPSFHLLYVSYKTWSLAAEMSFLASEFLAVTIPIIIFVVSKNKVYIIIFFFLWQGALTSKLNWVSGPAAWTVAAQWFGNLMRRLTGALIWRFSVRLHNVHLFSARTCAGMPLYHAAPQQILSVQKRVK